MDLLQTLVGGAPGSGNRLGLRVSLLRPALVVPAPEPPTSRRPAQGSSHNPSDPSRPLINAPPRRSVFSDGGGSVESPAIIGEDVGNSMICVYGPQDDVSGTVELRVPPGQEGGRGMEHHGLRIELVGRIEVRGSTKHHEFITLSRDLAPPSLLYSTKLYPFNFVGGISAAGYGEDQTYESYNGNNVSLRYFVRATLGAKGGIVGGIVGPTVTTRGFLINRVNALPIPVVPASDNPIKMEVGIEDCLHIEFEYGRRRYHLDDVVVGRVHFLLVRIRIRRMELALVRRESVADVGNPNATNESQTLAKFEVMDGQPAKGGAVPVRLFLGGIPADLTPTFRDVYGRFSVRYFLNLVLVDEEDRRYFKQQEIELWRKDMS